MTNKFLPIWLGTGLAAILLLTGCGTPKLASDMREGMPSAKQGPGTSQQEMDIQWEEEQEGWQEMKASMLTEEDDNSAKKRWDVVVYFAFDRSSIGSSQRPKVETAADFLKEHSNYTVTIEGHCDKRGSDEYNRALGERRALAVKDYLTSLGIDSSKINTVSYGEEKPAVPNADSAKEYAKNRRAEFVFNTKQ